MSDLISIIMPVQNMEKYLARSIDSVLAQTYKNFEIVLINYGSADSSKAICDEYVASDSRIKLVDKDDKGLSDARNAGVAHASGEYITFVDSDDYIHELFLEKMYTRIKSDNSDICMCTYHFVDEGEEDYSAMKSTPDTYDYHIEGLSEGLHTSDTVMKHISNTRMTVLWNKLYRRELFDGVSFPVGLLHEDEFVIHRIFAAADDVSVISDRLYFYLQRSSSIMGRSYSVRRLELLDAYADRVDFYIDNEKFDLLKCTCLGYIRRYAEAHVLLTKSKVNIHRLNESKKKFIEYRKTMFRYGGAYIGVRFLFAVISPRLNHAFSKRVQRLRNRDNS
ncbi:MAG: glycosyltransferase [Oscillospiraceae bacterium]|nr:glycosyltransferase [Oscillospiraceae bacterium]